MSEQEVANYVMVDSAYVSKERYVPVGTATTKSRVQNNLVLLYHALANATTEDPSNIKRFFSNTLSGGPVRVFEQQLTAKLVDITVEQYSNLVMTSTLGVQKLTIS
jgi:hypothetical protein